MKTRSKQELPHSPPPSSPNLDSDDSEKMLSRRQEQNRAAQRAFRERRAKLLREMDDRLRRLETILDVVAYQARRLADYERELIGLRQKVSEMENTFDTLTMTAPLWTVPNSERPIVEIPEAAGGALRPNSADPILDATNDFEE
jgi:hypothetical protein